MGGGTPLFEAARLGISVIGFDTNPMSRWIVERELEDVDPDELLSVGEKIAKAVELQVSELYLTDCPSCSDEVPVRYFIWVRQHVCQTCSREHTLLADTQIVSTKLSRHPREVHVCAHCLNVSEHKPGKRPKKCSSCRRDHDSGLIPSDTLRACECGTPFRIPPQGTIEEPRLKLAAVEYHCASCSTHKRATRHTFKQADARDLERVVRAEKLAAKHPSTYWPDELIPTGTETNRLLRWGYNRWRDLFNDRQLYGLGVLAAQISEEPEGPIKRALQTVFSDLLRYQNMLCRYDRQALKPTDVFAVHGFPVPRVACEAALLGERRVGSGGFRHGLEKYARAKRWCREPYEKMDDGKNSSTAPEHVASRFVASPLKLERSGDAYLRRASLQIDELQEASVDIVLTDPPYFANVQYGELMDFCYVWLRRLAPKVAFFKGTSAKTGDDAVGSGGDDPVDIVEFTSRISTVFEAATKALKPDGPFCFTYHHNDLDAYAPLVVACLNAGLVPTAVFACPSEMRSSTHIHQRNAASVDTLFVLRKPPLAAGHSEPKDEGMAAVKRHLAALRRVGFKPTDADYECLRSGQLAVATMAALGPNWTAGGDTAGLLDLATATLRKLAGVPAAARRVPVTA